MEDVLFSTRQTFDSANWLVFCNSAIYFLEFMEKIRQTMESKDTPVAAAATGKVYKAGSRVGRGVPDITGAYTKRCPCSRDKTIVFCRACGYYCNGRIRLKCEQHPRVTFLLDISECPRCHSSVFLDEYFRTQ